jgi:hypothetical protein
MKLSPIILLVYNRPEHTKKTVEALQKNKLAKDSLLYIFSDGPKREEDVPKIKKVRDYIKTIKGFKKVKIIERKKNLGLANSIIKSISDVVDKHGSVIEIEDDVVVSRNFLYYINYLINRYKNNKKIFSITGYNYPQMKIPLEYKYDVYFSKRFGGWGFATWSDRWKKVDWKIGDYREFKKSKKLQRKFNEAGDDLSDMLVSQMKEKIDSFAIRFCYYHFKNNAFCVYPIKSYVNNIGLDGSGVHCGKSENNKYSNKKLNEKINLRIPPKVELNKELADNFKKIFKKNYFKNIILKIIKR